MCQSRTVYGERTQDSKPSLSGCKARVGAPPVWPCSPPEVTNRRSAHVHGFWKLYLEGALWPEGVCLTLEGSKPFSPI